MNVQAKSHAFSLFIPDIILVLCVMGLTALGVAFIYSSGISSDGIQLSNEWIKQLIWAASGVLLMTFFAFLDYRRLLIIAIPAYILCLVLLMGVFAFGIEIRGARAWLSGVGNFGIQPSEFTKLAVILMLAWLFEKNTREKGALLTWAIAILITIIPIGLILLQPDMGTAMVFIPILLAIAYTAGVDWKLLLFPLFAGVLTAAGILGYAWSENISRLPLGFFRLFSEPRLIVIASISLTMLFFLILCGWIFFRQPFYLILLYIQGILISSYVGIIGAGHILKDYQMMRLVVFLNPEVDPQGAGWNIIQSVTAVGSGGVFGKGFLQGTQSQYRYLPEQSTDFIFSIIAEETGFLGALVIFGLFTIIVLRALQIAMVSQDSFGTYVAVGIVAMIGFHVIQNIGMAIGVMPITGIPLPLISYGGSSLWTLFISIGILLSIYSMRYREE